MNAEKYKVSKLPYIENASNKIMEKYQIRTQYETEPPHGDAIYSISIKGKVLPSMTFKPEKSHSGYMIH